MSPNRDELLVAIRWPEQNLVTRCQALDEIGAVVRPDEEIPLGRKVQLRFRIGRGGHAVRTYQAEVRRGTERDTYRLVFQGLTRLHAAEIKRLAVRAGLAEDAEADASRASSRPSLVRPNPLLHVSSPRVRETFVIRAYDADAQACVRAALAEGRVYIECEDPPETRLEVLLRVELAPEDVVYLKGRVEYRTRDPDGVGISLAASPALDDLLA